MPLPFTPVSFLTLSGTLNGFFLGLVFLRLPGPRRKANQILAILLMVLGFISLGAFLASSGIFARYPKTQKLYAPLFFALGPLLYFYAAALFRRDFSFRRRDWLHFLGVIANYLYNVPFYWKSDSEKIALLARGLASDVRVIRMLALLHFAIYVWLVWRLIIRGYREARNHLSSFDRLQVRWVGYVAAMYATVLLINIFPDVNWPPAGLFLSSWEALMVLLLGFLGLQQQARRGEGYPAAAVVPPETAAEADLAGPLQQIIRIMEQNKPYLDPDLTIEELARQAGLKVYICSSAINRMLGINFFTFVNGCRVEEAMRQLQAKTPRQTILDIALASGFNSKSTFNAIFKAKTGQTPSQFLKTRKTGG